VPRRRRAPVNVCEAACVRRVRRFHIDSLRPARTRSYTGHSLCQEPTLTSTFVGHTFSFPGVAAYAASKSGLIGLTQALAAEFGPEGIRVNAILPGAVDTQMYREMNATAESQAFITGLHALRRAALPDELARSVLYLASDESSFVTGTASLVDGGASITRT
jgi:NAD(P)-dependent dehydrogenase (short-subunit alcohol dehydrogenase family)